MSVPLSFNTPRAYERRKSRRREWLASRSAIGSQKVCTTPLNKRATNASALPKN